jgi:hypothetical protein
MYRIVESYVIDDLRQGFSLDDRMKVHSAKRALRKNPYPTEYRSKKKKDGSWQISIPIGVRRILVGYDVDEKQRLVLLNYMKWDGFREVLDSVVGLFKIDPGKNR